MHFSSSHKESIRTLKVRSPERQIVRVLIVIFLEHQKRNVNLQKGHFGSGGSVASLMIKSSKSTEWEKRIGLVRIAHLSQ